jgi:hypothetical protein
MTTYNFAPTSRYYGIDTASFTLPDGREISYLRRRFVPSADNFALLLLHTVTDGERLDNITAKYMDDPTAFWRVAAGNSAMRTEALAEVPGRIIRITLPQGVPGLPNA